MSVSPRTVHGTVHAAGARRLSGSLWLIQYKIMAIDEPGEHGEQAQHRFAGTVNAPEFPPGLEWINTDRPLRLADLRGKLVILDFWTFC